MDPQVESTAIKLLATQGLENYREFLKRKGAPDFLSNEEVAIITKQTFDYKTVCDRIAKRSTAALACVTTYTSAKVQRPTQPDTLVPQSGAELAFAEGIGPTADRSISDIMFNPSDDEATILGTLLKMINSAKSDVQVAMYIFTDATLFSALYDRAKAGVSVTLVLNSNRRQLSRFTKMVVGNTSIFETKPENMFIHCISGIKCGKKEGIAHQKFMIVDRRVAYTGSYNFTWFAANLNREQAVFTVASREGRDPIIRKLEEQMTQLVENSSIYRWPKKRS